MRTAKETSVGSEATRDGSEWIFDEKNSLFSPDKHIHHPGLNALQGSPAGRIIEIIKERYISENGWEIICLVEGEHGLSVILNDKDEKSVSMRPPRINFLNSDFNPREIADGYLGTLLPLDPEIDKIILDSGLYPGSIVAGFNPILNSDNKGYIQKGVGYVTINYRTPEKEISIINGKLSSKKKLLQNAQSEVEILEKRKEQVLARKTLDSTPLFTPPQK